MALTGSGANNASSVNASLVGGLLVAVELNYEGALGTPTISDGGNSYSPILTKTHPSVALNLCVFAFIARASGAVTLSASGAGSFPNIRWAQFYGISSVSVDVSVSATGTGSTPNSGSVTTTNASDVIFGAACGFRSAGVFTVGGGFTILQATNGSDCGAIEWLQQSSPGSQSATFGYNQDWWICAMVAFQGTAFAPFMVGPNMTPLITDADIGAKHQPMRAPEAAASAAPSGGPVPVASQLKGGIVGAAYSETISAQGGTGPYTFAVTSGALPAGTSLAGSTGVISGTPTTVATYSFTITVTDAASDTGSQAFSIDVTSVGGSNSGYTS